jgi:hypothetical protein
MSDTDPLNHLYPPLHALIKAIDAEPDSARNRFIGCALQSLELAIKMDKPNSDLRPLFDTQSSMMSDALDAWSSESEF